MPLPPEQTVTVKVDNEEPTLHFTQTIGGTQDVVLRNRSGQVVDLTDAEVTLVIKEQSGDTETVAEVECTVTDESGGGVSVEIEEDVLTYAGVLLGQFVITKASKVTALVGCFLNVEPDLRVSNDPEPLTITEVRTNIQDRCSAENDLLGDVDFSDTLIVRAILAAVRYWNETPPDDITYTQVTFPYHTQLMDGTLWKLFETRALNLSRNRMKLVAGGIDHDDRDRVTALREAANGYATLYKQWVIDRKAATAIGNFYGTESNPYFG